MSCKTCKTREKRLGNKSVRQVHINFHELKYEEKRREKHVCISSVIKTNENIRSFSFHRITMANFVVGNVVVFKS